MIDYNIVYTPEDVRVGVLHYAPETGTGTIDLFKQHMNMNGVLRAFYNAGITHLDNSRTELWASFRDDSLQSTVKRRVSRFDRDALVEVEV